MAQHPDPDWVAVGRAIRDLILDSGLDDRGGRYAINHATELISNPALAAPPLLNVDARNPDAITVLNPYGGPRPHP